MGSASALTPIADICRGARHVFSVPEVDKTSPPPLEEHHGTLALWPLLEERQDANDGYVLHDRFGPQDKVAQVQRYARFFALTVQHVRGRA
jgi:hypothetical protein